MIPIGEVLVKIKVCDEMICKCCGNNEQETVEYLFIKCLVANQIWRKFAAAAGVEGPFLQLRTLCTSGRLQTSV